MTLSAVMAVDVHGQVIADTINGAQHSGIGGHEDAHPDFREPLLEAAERASGGRTPFPPADATASSTATACSPSSSPAS